MTAAVDMSFVRSVAGTGVWRIIYFRTVLNRGVRRRGVRVSIHWGFRGHAYGDGFKGHQEWGEGDEQLGENKDIEQQIWSSLR